MPAVRAASGGRRRTSPGARAHARGASGFTLVELVVVIALSALVAGIVSGFITRPMEAYRDVTLRATLVDVAESALRRMSRDVQAALPNSLRVSPDGRVLELLHTVDGARYRRGPGQNPGGADHTAPDDWLSFAGDDRFNVLGRLAHVPFTYGAPLPLGTRLAIYTTDTSAWVDAATGANPGTITPASTVLTVVDDGDEDQWQLAPAFRFRFESPRRRLFVVDGPVTYRCDLGVGALVRHDAYGITAAQPTDPLVAPLATSRAAPVADRVADCAFDYAPGAPTRAGVVTIRLLVAQGGEQVRLLHQVHVENAP